MSTNIPRWRVVICVVAVLTMGSASAGFPVNHSYAYGRVMYVKVAPLPTGARRLPGTRLLAAPVRWRDETWKDNDPIKAAFDQVSLPVQPDSRSRTGGDPGLISRYAATLVVLTISVFVAQGVGLVDLIAKGYRFVSWVLIAIFVVPLGLRFLLSRSSRRLVERGDES